MPCAPCLSYRNYVPYTLYVLYVPYMHVKLNATADHNQISFDTNVHTQNCILNECITSQHYVAYVAGFAAEGF
jgi:hypothetical protein